MPLHQGLDERIFPGPGRPRHDEQKTRTQALRRLPYDPGET
jgi:hypothetical protein